MNCTNCGAAMELVESRRYFRCGHCGAFQFPDGPESDGLRIVGRLADATACPVCGSSMDQALLDDNPVDFCGRCRGVLLPRATFAHVTMKRRAWATTPPADPVPLDRRELTRQLSCPKCHGRFDTYPHYGPGSVVIDNCTRCDLIWLDFGEMKAIVDAPGSDRGARHLRRIDEDFVRQGMRPQAAGDDDENGRGTKRANEPLRFLIDLLFGD